MSHQGFRGGTFSSSGSSGWAAVVELPDRRAEREQPLFACAAVFPLVLDPSLLLHLLVTVMAASTPSSSAPDQYQQALGLPIPAPTLSRNFRLCCDLEAVRSVGEGLHGDGGQCVGGSSRSSLTG